MTGTYFQYGKLKYYQNTTAMDITGQKDDLKQLSERQYRTRTQGTADDVGRDSDKGKLSLYYPVTKDNN